MKKFLVLCAFLLCTFTQVSFAQLSTEGREFWVGFMDIIANSGPLEQKLYITSRVNTTATITVGNILAPSSSQTVNISADAITTVTFENLETTLNEVILNNGIRVVSPNLISVFASHENSARTEASVVLPVNSLGNNPEYIITGYPGVGAPSGNASEFLIVGVEDGAQVQITPSAITSTGRPAGQPFTITLNRGQLYQVQAQETPSGTPASSLNLYDMTGSRVITTNCRRVAVFAGVNATHITFSCGTPQHIYDQVFPLQAWGRDYVVAPLATSTGGYVCRVTASENNTQVTFGTDNLVLQSGATADFDIPDATPRCVTANKPIAVTQFMKGTNCNGAGNRGDPAMVVLNPVTQTIRKITYPTIPRGGTSVSHYINIVTKQINTDKIKLNGALLPVSSFTNVCSNYAYASINTFTGAGSEAFTLESDSTFIAYAYGYSPNEGYAFSVGGAFENEQYNFNIPEAVCVNTPINIRGYGLNISTYTWDFGNGQTATGQNVTTSFAAAGIYDIKMTVNIIGALCTGQVTKTIEVLDFPTVNIGGNRIACPGGTVALSANPQPFGSTYLWSNGATTPTINVGVGTYSLKVRNRAGCETTSNTVQVSPLPSLTLTMNVGTTYCTTSPPLTLAGTPAGGFFRINNILSTVFNPSLLGVGTHTVTYTVLGGDGCDHVLTRIVEVTSIPFANFSLASTFCRSSAPVTLAGTPAGGIFTINGTPATVFDPAALGVGVHEVVYTITVSAGCSNSTTRAARINDSPVIAFTNLQRQYCIGASSFTVNATPAGGTIRINGVVTALFNPTALGLGTHTVNYSIPPAAGCPASTRDFVVDIVNVPTVQITNLNAQYCNNSPEFTLTGNPSGGTFFLGGNALTSINPQVLGLGNHTLEYRYADNITQCQGTTTRNFQIVAAPTSNDMRFTNLNDFYCFDSPAFTLEASPAGGVFKVKGVVSTNFDPTALGGGMHSVEYTYTNTNNCSHTIVKDVIITPKINYNFNNIKPIHCTNDGLIIPQISPANAGTIQLNGKTITNINFAEIGVGNYTLTFVATTDKLGCNQYAQPFQVLQSPASVEIPAVEVCTSKGDSAMLKAPTGSSYLWNTGATTQNITVKQAGKYSVKVFNGGICSAQSLVEVKEVCDTKIHAPTAFTPNGDGLNDTFEILGIGFDQLEVWIFNKWGEVVFLGKARANQNVTWDGKINGSDAPSDTYVCKLRYRASQNTFLSEKTQTITLIR